MVFPGDGFFFSSEKYYTQKPDIPQNQIGAPGNFLARGIYTNLSKAVL
jgi:hypothetical protein